jgi:hypothetical protein
VLVVFVEDGVRSDRNLRCAFLHPKLVLISQLQFLPAIANSSETPLL